jgi:signal transduction histidine kinase
VEAIELGELLGPDGTIGAAAVAQRVKHDSDGDAALFVMQIADGRGEVLFRSANLGDTILPALGPEAHRTLTLPFLGRVHVSEFAKGPWRIRIGSILAPSERLLRDYARISIMLIVGVALFSVGLGYAFSRQTLRPIRAIQATANRIRSDHLSERIPVPSGRDELASLTVLLNQMFDRLQTAFEQVGRFAADASHELKTPLALIRLNAEKLRARLADDPEAAAALADILDELTRLHAVMDRLLFLAKSESGALRLTLRPVAIAEFLAEFAEDAQALAEDRGVRFALGDNRPGELRADPELLRQLLLNLVANAVAVSPPGGAVTLASGPAADGWGITVADEGPGLPESQLARIFERFVRVEPAGADAAARPGHGLGLAICRSIAGLHGGTIRAENRPGRSGLAVTLALPR